MADWALDPLSSTLTSALSLNVPLGTPPLDTICPTHGPGPGEPDSSRGSYRSSCPPRGPWQNTGPAQRWGPTRIPRGLREGTGGTREARGTHRRRRRRRWGELAVASWDAFLFLKCARQEFIPNSESRGREAYARMPAPPGHLHGAWRPTATRGSDSERDEAVVALNVSLEDLGAGAQHALEARPVQLHALEGSPGHHGGRTWSV